MPVRLVCPSCSATLSVKDEYAGRAVKCPKCAGVIPASGTATAPAPVASSPSKAAMPALPPPPTPQTPAKSPFEELDEPAKPSGPKITGRPTGKPVAKSDSEDLPHEDDDKPAKRKGRDEDRDDRGARGGKRDRDRDDADDDRPSRAKRARGDDDDDDGPRTKKGGGGSTAVIIIGMIGFFLLTCCGGVGYGVYWFYNRAKETVQQVKDDIEKTNSRVTQFNYEQLKVGTMTRSQAEVTLGTGKLATSEDLQKAFPNNADLEKMNKWVEKVGSQRAVIWRNGDDYLLVAFHPNAEATSRVQMKEWRPKGGANASAGEPDDAKFAKGNDQKPQPPDKAITPGTKVQAEDLAREFKTDPTAAAAKYANKTFLVNGTVSNIEVVGGETRVILEGVPGEDGVRVSCAMKKYLSTSPFSYDRGQRQVFEGRCVGVTAGVVSFKDCAITEAGKRLAETVTARALIDAYRTETAGDAKFKGKPIEVENGEVEKMTPDGTLILIPFAMVPGSKPPSKKIRVEYDPSYKVLVPKMKVGSLVSVKGLCEGVKDGEIVITRGWIIPSYHLQNN